MSGAEAQAAEQAAAQFVQRLAAFQPRLSIVPDKPQETAEGSLKALWHLAAGRPVSFEAACEDPALPQLDAAALQRLDALLDKRLSGVPLAYLTGRQRFMGLDMLAGPEALIPRRETELLGQTALNLLREHLQRAGGARVIDVCTGSGNLALAVAHHEPGVSVSASDLAPEAVALARRNAKHLGLASRIDLREGDLLAPFDEPAFHGQVDLLLCNPPYISSGKVDTLPPEISGFEPRLAFDGGPLGVRILQRLIREAPRFLAPRGWLAFEVGLGQGPAVLRRLEASGSFRQPQALRDSAGEIRAVLASRSTPL